MTPREWCLLEDGHAEAAMERERRIAYWMSLHLTAATGQITHPWQLLGEEQPADTEVISASELSAHEAEYDAMMRKIAEAAKEPPKG
jgi:hypothetical protein